MCLKLKIKIKWSLIWIQSSIIIPVIKYFSWRWFLTSQVLKRLPVSMETAWSCWRCSVFSGVLWSRWPRASDWSITLKHYGLSVAWSCVLFSALMKDNLFSSLWNHRNCIFDHVKTGNPWRSCASRLLLHGRLSPSAGDGAQLHQTGFSATLMFISLFPLEN